MWLEEVDGPGIETDLRAGKVEKRNSAYDGGGEACPYLAVRATQ